MISSNDNLNSSECESNKSCFSGVIHTYITGLLFRPHTEEDPNLYLTLPPIHNSRSNPSINESNGLSNGRRFSGYDLTNTGKNSDFFKIQRALEDSEFPNYNLNNKFISNSYKYPIRTKSVEEFK